MGHKNFNIHDKFPKSIKNATSTSDGLMSSEDKASLDSIFEFGLLSPATIDKDGIMTKEDKKKLDDIEENANNYVHPDTPDIRHVTDVQINKWNSQVKYNNEEAMLETVGGIEKGTKFNNMDYKDLLDKLLYVYVSPTISDIVLSPNNKSIVEKGNTFILNNIRFNISTPSLKDTESIKYEIKVNDKTFHTSTTENRSINISAMASISDDSTISVTTTDSVNNKVETFKLIDYKFIYPMYYGIINSTDTLNNTLIKSKTKLLQEKGTKTIKFTTTNQKVMFAYPKSYGLLKKVIDPNDFNVLNSFYISEINITANDYLSVPYYVYTTDDISVSNYQLQFLF